MHIIGINRAPIRCSWMFWIIMTLDSLYVYLTITEKIPFQLTHWLCATSENIVCGFPLSSEDLVHSGTSAPGFSNFKKLYFWVIKNIKKIHICLHISYISLWSFGEKRVLFWAIEKKNWLYFSQNLSFFCSPKYNVFLYESFRVHSGCDYLLFRWFFEDLEIQFWIFKRKENTGAHVCNKHFPLSSSLLLSLFPPPILHLFPTLCFLIGI